MLLFDLESFKVVDGAIVKESEKMIYIEQDQIDWSQVDSKWKYMARNANGTAYFHEREPNKDNGKSWRSMSTAQVTQRSYKRGNRLWSDSLVERPETRVVIEADQFVISVPVNWETEKEQKPMTTDKVRKFKGNNFGNIATIKYEGEHYVIYETDGDERSLPKSEFFDIYTEIKEHEFWVNVYEGGVSNRFNTLDDAMNLITEYPHLGKYIRTQKFTVEI